MMLTVLFDAPLVVSRAWLELWASVDHLDHMYVSSTFH